MIPKSLKSLSGLGFTGLFAYGAIGGYHERVRQGQNPVFAAALEGGGFAAQFLLPTAAQLGLFVGIPVARMAGQMVTQKIADHNVAIRQARTPFSHRFEHTDVSARAQALGMRSIGAAWGHANMGTEAALFSRRYGR